jgi:UDP-GlcNAc:undecaprenyl-phosphate GlcNAc-1-phosphate transferase
MVLGGLCSVFLLLFPWVRALFVDSGQRWLYIFLVSLIFSMTSTPVARWLGFSLRVMDYPGDRRIHQLPTPRLGGLAVFFGFILAVLANMVLPDQIVVVLFTGILMLVVGIMDDTWELPAWTKLVTQLVASGIVISWGMVLTVFPEGLLGDMGNIILTVLWLVGITNAFNFMDGMDGLASGLSVLIAFFLGFLAFQTNQVELGWLSIAIIGASLGFLPYIDFLGTYLRHDLSHGRPGGNGESELHTGMVRLCWTRPSPSSFSAGTWKSTGGGADDFHLDDLSWIGCDGSSKKRCS